MVKNDDVKGFFRRTFICCRKKQQEPEPAKVFTISENESITENKITSTFEEDGKIPNKDLRRPSAVSYKSCTSSFRSVSTTSLQSVLSRNTNNFDYYSIYSNVSDDRTSFNSVVD